MVRSGEGGDSSLEKGGEKEGCKNHADNRAKRGTERKQTVRLDRDGTSRRNRFATPVDHRLPRGSRIRGVKTTRECLIGLWNTWMPKGRKGGGKRQREKDRKGRKRESEMKLNSREKEKKKKI